MNFKKHSKFLIVFVALLFFYALIHGTFSIYREIKDDSIDLNILDPSTTFTITFDPQNGDSTFTRTKSYNDPIGQLTTPDKTGFIFVGWYTHPSSGTKIHANTLVTGTATYYAHYEKIVCKKATTRHSETCYSSGSCYTKGYYSNNETIYYGTIPDNTSPKTGDAYDCDVNDDGVYDAATERFYYIREVVDTSGSEPVGNGFLVHYTSFDQSGQMDSSKTRGSYVYETAVNYLPNSTDWPTNDPWDNAKLISMNGNVTRFINSDDITEACGSSTGNNFSSCLFFAENSRFQSSNLGRAGIWLESDGNTYHRIQTQNLVVAEVDSTSENTARPVIQLPSNTIEGYREKELYTITFNGNGGTPSITQLNKYDGQKIGAFPTEPTQTGYTFDGWYTAASGGTEVTVNTVVTGNDTYYAHWLTNLTVEFNANGGTVSPSSKTVPQGRAIGELPVPLNPGYDFLGWYTAASGGTEINENTIINTSGIVYYAHWQASSELDYVFRIPGECSFTSSGLANGSNGNCVSTINPTGSDIDYTDSTLSAKKYIDTQIALYDTTNHDKDYEIGFTIVSYTTSSQASRATLVNTKAEVNTSSLKYPGVVFRRDEATDNFILQSRETLSTNASYTVASSTVTSVKIYRLSNEIYYSINGGAKTPLNSLSQYNPVFDLTTWFGAAPTNAQASGAQRYFIGTLSDMYIKLETEPPTTAKIRFDENYQGGSVTESDYPLNQAIGQLPTPTRSGYSLIGWFTDPTNGTQINESTLVTAATTYYAHWGENITVSYNANGGTVSPNSKTFATGTAIGELPTPEYAGHTFKGWYTDTSWTTPVDSSTVFNSSTSIVAKWVQNITVTFDAGSGTVSPNSKTFEPGTAIGELPTPEYTGYTFKGWYTDNTWTTPVDSSTVFNSTTSIVAKWVQNVTITFNADGGTASFNSKSIEPGTTIGELPTATKTDFTFDGWYLDNSAYDTPITTSTVANTDLNVIAKWISANYVAEVNGTRYETLAEAIAAVPTTGVKTTVTLLKDVSTSARIYIASTQNVELTMGNFTITGSTVVFDNEGTLHINDGTIISTSTVTATERAIMNRTGGVINISGGLLKGTGTNVMENTGTVNITGGRLECNASAAVINNEAGGILNVSGGQIVGTASSKGQGIYNNGGTTTISGTANIQNYSQTGSSGRASVHNNAGTVNILGGTIISGRNAAVKNNGTMTIGTDDGTIDITSPVMQGYIYGLETVSGKTVNIFDGIFKGRGTPNKAISDESVTSHSTYVITHTTETIGSDTYDVAYLVNPAVNYTVTFDATTNGGSINPGENNTQTYNSIGPIGSMPSASKSNTSFLGWYTAASGGEKVLETTEVNDDITYYAHYTSQTTVCRPASTLHSNGGTNFGQIHSGSTLSAGDAFDCDVNGDGTYDATNERFYFLTNSSDGNAVFVFANNISQQNSSATPMCKATAVPYGSNGPLTAMEELPTISQWSNVSIYSQPRNITNGSATISSDFVYTGKAARFATLDEIKAATSSSINGTTNELASYTFLLENTASYGDCRSNYWLETPYSASNIYRIDGSSSKKLGNAAISTGNSGVRPVIEIPYESIDGVVNIINFDVMSPAMRTYFNSISTWSSGQTDSSHSSFDTSMTNNLNTNKCVYFENDNRDTEVNYSSGYNVYCDQPNQYDTGVTGNVNVYEYNESTGTISNSQASYVTNNNGKLYNFIPGKVYYWESATDSSKHGYVRPTGERRIISIDNTAPNSTKYKTRNVRDLGGIKVDTNNDGIIDGTIKYGKLFRGEKIWGGDGTTVQYFTKLGIANEMDLRADSEVVTSNEDSLHKITSNPANANNKVFEIIHYGIDYTNDYSNYTLSRKAATRVMYEFVKAHNNGNDNYSLYFHCRIGADRTGTLAYILEGLLGAPTEERYRDYELTVFFGLRERTRFYYNKGN